MFGLKYLKNVATLKLNPILCIGCGMCVMVCPHQVFMLVKTKAQIVAFNQCMECGGCARNCPTSAITVNAGVGCATAVIQGTLRGTAASCDCDSSTGGCCN